MVVLICICFKQCGKIIIFVNVDYTIEDRQLNLTTVIDVEFLDGGEIKNHWCISVFVLTREACSTSLHKFL